MGAATPAARRRDPSSWRTTLTTVLLECHRKARADAKAKTNRAIDEADPRIRNQLEQTHVPESAPLPHQTPLTENDIQAADDEYFERRNLYGGWTDRR